eukprot:CAMPEP_0116131766 /NCGR_PEP_ID=MMETSP0329-20121206/9185_1 /TAXON_ID=697910 /ORGANISM="Pseudo-nitzschia arenysensis, Strain B593" /LENGTH=492 /DNA_ID=CAMNT_0003626227 /DNA_START=297 /DNA_END=1775 /DNA_ORIENTATION=-
MIKITSIALLSLIAILATGPTASRCAQGFVARSPSTSSSKPAFVSFRGGKVAATAANVEAEKVPSWESLESKLEELKSSNGEEKKPVLTLYRDNNGWCPFCERVWVAIRAKGLPYQETLVPLQGKPEWYKQMVPTGLVPAVLFHGDEGEDSDTSRELVWESDAILEALDAKFPDTVQLMKKEDKAFDDALEMQNRVQIAGVKFAYGNRNDTMTEAEKEEIRSNFESALDELDAALGEQAEASGTEKCFRLGTEFTGVDAMMIPTLERWRYQLPLSANLDILENRNNIKNWFDAMDSYEAYTERVAGDEYSWTAAASMFLRYFGGGEDKPKVAEAIARADAAAEQLAKEFIAADIEGTDKQDAALEAAAKLISNHEAVVADCVKEEPLTQKNIPRATGADTADRLLRHVSSVLLQIAAEPSSLTETSASELVEDCDADATVQGALALQTVSKRLCVPRDMGAPSAALLRGILSSVAENLLADEGAKEADAVAA